MKHILFAIGSLQGGGAERVVSVWTSALAKKGYKVSVLVYARHENEYPIDPNVGVYTIAESVKACNDMPMIERLRCFRKILKVQKPDVIISFLPEVQVYVALASIGLRIPRIETVRNNPWKEKVLKTKFAKLWLWCFYSCKAIIVQSEDQKTFFKNSVQEKAVVIPNPVNPQYIENEKKEYAETKKIVAAGRLAEQKNPKMMIDAVKLLSQRYKDVTLEIYGIGTLQEELDAYIKEQKLTDKVFLMGRNDALYNVYKQADAYVMSSDYEGMPNALVEAMAVGLPCVSTDCKTGPRDLIDDGKNGFLVPCGDYKALAEKLERIVLMSAKERMTLGKNARNKIITFCGEENSLNRLISVIEGII